MATAVSNRRDLAERIRKLSPELRARGVHQLSLFGSFARDSQKPDSDVDLLVQFSPGEKTFDNFLAVCEILEERLNRRVELLTPESLSPHIGPRILQEAENVLSAD